MGMGDFPMGEGPAGADPVYLPAPSTPVLAPRAVFYNVALRQLQLTDDNGNAIDMDPIDQIVWSRTTPQQGSSASSPTLGTKILARFKLAPPSKHAQIAFQEMATVLADLIAAGDIQLNGVGFTTDPSTDAQIVIPNYTNLRNPNASSLYPTAASSSLLTP